MLVGGKTLITPQPRLRTGFFSRLHRNDLPGQDTLQEACTSAGAAKYGTPLALDTPLKVRPAPLLPPFPLGCLSLRGRSRGTV